MAAVPPTESWPFPVLGIPEHRWDGRRKLLLRSAVRPVEPGTGASVFGHSTTVAVSHGYYPDGEQLPAVVISQAPAYPGRTGSNSALSLLLRAKERPTLDAPARTAREMISIAGIEVESVHSWWHDTPVEQARFDWRNRRVEIATWEIPLSTNFFDLVNTLEIGQ